MRKANPTSEPSTKKNAEKPISLAPLSTTDALRGLLQIKPMKGEAIAKASKKRAVKVKRKANGSTINQ